MNNIYYKRELSQELMNLFKEGGELNWIIDFVKREDSLDFQTGSNNGKSWFSIYRGTGRVLTITTNRNGVPKFDASEVYKELCRDFYSNPSKEEFRKLLEQIGQKDTLKRYYDMSNEGFFQTLIGRRFSLFCKEEDEFVIIDKEFILGYESKKVRDKCTEQLVNKYQGIIDELKNGGDAWTKNLEQTGNECDFVAINREGDIILIELKHGKNTSGVSLSPLQVNKYADLLEKYLKIPENDFEKVVRNMIKQKIALRILNPKWEIPEKLSGTIFRYVVCGSQNIERYPTKDAKKRFCEIRKAVKNEGIKLFVCDMKGNLKELL